MSPTDDLFSTGYPGGIYNDGFAASWIGAADRRRQGRPPPTATARWSRALDDPGVERRPALDLLRDRRGAGGQRTGRRRPAWPTRRSTSSRESLAGLVGPAAGRPGHRAGPGPVAVRPPVHGRLGQPHHRAGLPVRRAPGRADRAAVAGADRRHARRPRRCSPTWSTAATSTRPTPRRSAAGSSSSTSTWPTRSRPQPSGLGRRRPRRVHQLRVGRLGPGAAAGHPLHRRAKTWPPPARSSPTQTPLVRGALRQRRRSRSGPGDIAVDLLGRTSPAGRRRARSTTLYFGPGGVAARRQPPTATGSATLHPGPGGAARDQPARRRQRLGGRSRLGLDAGPGRRRHRLPDRARSPTATTIVGPATLDLWVKAAAPVEDFQATITEVRPATRPGGVRHLGLPAQLEPGRPARLDAAVHRSRPTWPRTLGTCRRIDTPW